MAIITTIALMLCFHHLVDGQTETYEFHFSIDNDERFDLKPEIEGYRLMLNNSGPAVIDSIITFDATLHRAQWPSIANPMPQDSDDDAENSTYLFKWVPLLTCEGSLRPRTCSNTTEFNDTDATVTLKRVYSMFDVVLPKKVYMYVMVVTAQKYTMSDGYVQIAEKSIKFILTETLNGKLWIYQNTTLGHPTRPVKTYSTATSIMLNANITDKFHHPKYITVWHIHGPHSNITYQHHNMSLSLLLSTSGHYVISVNVTVNMTVLDQYGIDHFSKRSGSFTEKIILKDPVSEISLDGNHHYVPGSNLSEYLKCSGSPPFQMTVILTDPDSVEILMVFKTLYMCVLHVSQPYLNKLGTYHMHVSIENDVSSVRDVLSITVKNAPRPVGVRVILPVFMVLITLIVPAVTIYCYVIYQRRRRNVESADFSFRGDEERTRRISITNTLSTWVNKIKSCFSCKREYICNREGQNNNYHYVQMKTLTTSYGATA